MTNKQLMAIQLHWINKEVIHNGCSNLVARKHNVCVLCPTVKQTAMSINGTVTCSKSFYMQ